MSDPFAGLHEGDVVETIRYGRDPLSYLPFTQLPIPFQVSQFVVSMRERPEREHRASPANDCRT